METHLCIRVLLAVALTLLPAVRARAQTDGVGRLRAQEPLLRALLETAAGQSPTLRGLVDRLEHSDVIVYMRCHDFSSALLKGRTYLMASRPGVRYVSIDLTCRDADPRLAVMLAHELHHAVEIASAPSVVDAESMARLYSEIGYLTCPWSGLKWYDTTEALETGERVRRELVHASVPSRHAARSAADRGDNDRSKTFVD
jgi:hypothetical protein